MSESSPDIARQPHAVLDLPSRRCKGQKIERLLKLHCQPQPIRMLEIGTGSGGIAHYFATHPTLRIEVDAIDTRDSRLIKEGYRYRQVTDTRLPFAGESFDVVLSNHVIEHVGNAAEQRRHLQEIRRVLRWNGVGYLAVPNRWMFIEPHYRLAFLSWLPTFLRTPYLRMSGRGKRYDCVPLTLRGLDAMLQETGFAWCHMELEALRVTLEIEDAVGPAWRVASRLPDPLLVWARPLIPTLICRIQRARS